MSAGARYLRFLLFAGVLAAGVGGIGAPLTRAAAGSAAVPAMIVALAVCWVAAAVGGLPVLAAARAEPGRTAAGAGEPLTAALAAMVLRLAAVAVGAVVVVLSGIVPRVPFLLWTGIGYVVLLAVETWYAVGEVRRLEPAAEATDEARTERLDAALRPRVTETEKR